MNAATGNENSWTRGFSGWLIRRAVAADEDPCDPLPRARLGLLQGWTSMVLNLFIAVAKAVMGFILGSIALIADSVDSVFDVLGSVIVVAGFYWSRKPRDVEHPFGHGRIDMIAGLVMSVLLIVVGVELAHASVRRILQPSMYAASWWIIGTVAATIPLKAWLADFAHRISRATGSPSLEAGYWFHRFDSFTSGAVCVGLILSRYGVARVDGWLGLAIAGLIAWTGVKLVMSSIGPLLGEAPSAEEVEAILRSARETAGVDGAHDVIVHKYGDVKLASFHIEVDAAKSALDVHDLAEEVERVVEEKTGCKAIVHVDPVDRRHPLYDQARRCMTDLVSRDPRISEFHDLRVWGGRKTPGLSVDVVVRIGVSESESAEVQASVKRTLESSLPGLRETTVDIEAAYSARDGAS